MADDVNSPAKWDADYARGTAGWDLGGPTPVFTRLLRSGSLRPGRAIVLGAGRGHDARQFARRGFSVTAVDFSVFAAREMQRLAEPDAPVDIWQADLFTLPHTLDGTFDYTLEYTCFCAIDPARRGEYADLVQRLLRPGGLHVHLAFPLGAHGGGPPFAVSAEQILRLFRERGFSLQSREVPPDSVAPRRGREELFLLRKAG